MKPDPRKLLRLRRLERLRDAERLTATREAAGCESQLARIAALVRRSETLGQDGAGTLGELSGAALLARTVFASQIDALTNQVAREHAHAENTANNARQALTSASHRRDRVAQRANTLARQLLNARNYPAHNAQIAGRTRFGTEVE